MSNKDTLQRFVFENQQVRGEFIHLYESYQTIIKQHDYPLPIRKLLGEALCAAALLSASIKFDGRLTVQFRGKGNLQLLLAQCDNQLQLRGLVKWDGEMTYEDLMASFHEGELAIMLDSGPTKKRYQGIVAWRGNSLSESIEGYFNSSEQLSTKIWFAVDELSAVGFLLQVIPSSTVEMEKIEKDPGWAHIVQQTIQRLDIKAMLEGDYPAFLTRLYPDEEIRVFPAAPVSFYCGCSRRRCEDAIMLLGRKEAEAELKEKQSIVVTCDFCNKEYLFDRVDVASIFEDKNRPSPHTHLH